MAKFQHWRSWLREPVVQFLLIGASLFVVHTALRPSQKQASSEIVITDDQAAALVSQFASTWQRAPSKQELQSLIDDEVRTEVYVREAMKLGLDQNDTIIRRRLRQKMEFLNESQLANKAPAASETLRLTSPPIPSDTAPMQRCRFAMSSLIPNNAVIPLRMTCRRLLLLLNNQDQGMSSRPR